MSHGKPKRLAAGVYDYRGFTIYRVGRFPRSARWCARTGSIVNGTAIIANGDSLAEVLRLIDCHIGATA